MNVYLGFMDKDSIVELCKYLDIVFFDLVFDDEIIREVYKMKKSKEDYIEVYNII